MNSVNVQKVVLPSAGGNVIRFVGVLIGGIILWAVLGVVAIQLIQVGILQAGTNLVMLIALTAIGLTIYGLIKMSRNARERIATAQINALKQVADGPIEHVSTNGRYFAIAVTKTRLLILEFGKVASIPFGAIRDAWWAVPGWETHRVYGLGPSALVADHYAQQANDAAMGEAYRNSGFFVRVADKQHPQWRFFTRNVALLQQWEEILIQAIEQAPAESMPVSPAAAENIDIQRMKVTPSNSPVSQLGLGMTVLSVITSALGTSFLGTFVVLSIGAGLVYFAPTGFWFLLALPVMIYGLRRLYLNLLETKSKRHAVALTALAAFGAGMLLDLITGYYFSGVLGSIFGFSPYFPIWVAIGML